jgi:hypothetical protein
MTYNSYDRPNYVTPANPDALRYLRSRVDAGPTLCVFEASATRFELFLGHSDNMFHATPEPYCTPHLVVALLNFGVCWHFPCDHEIDARYVAEKLRFTNSIDPQNLANLINYLNHQTEDCNG